MPEPRKTKDLLIIDHPTSLSVVGAVLSAVGAMYPSCWMQTDTGHVIHIQVDADAVPHDIDWERLPELAEYPLEDIEEVAKIS